MLGLPAHFFGDLLAVFLFGVVLIFLVAFGCRVVDYFWTKLELEDQVQKGNVSAGIVMASVVLGLCYAISKVIAAILGGS